MTAAELDALAEMVKRFHETMTPSEWHVIWSESETDEFSNSVGGFAIGPYADDMADAFLFSATLPDAEEQLGKTFEGVATIRNALPAILAALQQAKSDREEAERLTINAGTARGANDTLRSINRRLRLRHDPSCGALQESEEGEPKPCNCFQSMMIQNGQLRDENERLAAGLKKIVAYAQMGIDNDAAVRADATDHIRVREACVALLAARTAAAKEGTK